jgi:hypothetical protein
MYTRSFLLKNIGNISDVDYFLNYGEDKVSKKY